MCSCHWYVVTADGLYLNSTFLVLLTTQSTLHYCHIHPFGNELIHCHHYVWLMWGQYLAQRDLDIWTGRAGGWTTDLLVSFCSNSKIPAAQSLAMPTPRYQSTFALGMTPQWLEVIMFPQICPKRFYPPLKNGILCQQINYNKCLDYISPHKNEVNSSFCSTLKLKSL